MRVEDQVVKTLKELMIERKWFVLKMHGSTFQAGFPDLFCAHHTYGVRLIEVKTPRGAFTPAQRRVFHELAAKNVGIWVLVGDVPIDRSILKMELDKLHRPPNWYHYL